MSNRRFEFSYKGALYILDFDLWNNDVWLFNRSGKSMVYRNNVQEITEQFFPEAVSIETFEKLVKSEY